MDAPHNPIRNEGKKRDDHTAHETAFIALENAFRTSAKKDGSCRARRDILCVPLILIDRLTIDRRLLTVGGW
jgi:hypothetical protein